MSSPRVIALTAAMLLYRPLIAAYQHTPHAGVKRFLLRELADPVLHAEPEEVLAALPRASADAAVLFTVVALAERALTLRLTTRDPERSLGGLWTCQAAGRALVDRVRHTVAAPVLQHAGGALLAPLAAQVIPHADVRARALVLAALGCCGPAAGLAPLADELAQGRSPGAAAVGLALARPEGADTVLFRAVQARGLDGTSGWIGTALRGVASADTLPLLRRLVASRSDDLLEQAALALEAFPPDEARAALDAFTGELSPLVRLHLLASLGRLGLPGGLATLERLTRAGDPEILRVTALRAAAGSTDPDVRGWVASALTRSTGVERSVALEVLVILGAGSGDEAGGFRADTGADGPGGARAVLEGARRAAAATGGRELLVGLVALAVVAPDEALGRCRELVSSPSLDSWYLATYALRYVRRPGAVPLLERVLNAARGTPLEEIAAGALARHLDHPTVVPLLLGELARGPAVTTAVRILADLARHLPEELVPDAAAGLRELLDGPLEAQVLGPTLAALGALGHATDLPRLLAATRGPAGAHAILALELLMDPDALDELRTLSRERGELAHPARLARVRLGDAASVSELASSLSSAEAAHCGGLVFDLGLTLRCVPHVSRLALLHRTLVRGGAGRTLSQRVALADAPRPEAPPGLDVVLSRSRAPSATARPTGPYSALELPRAGARDAGGRPSLYVELGQAWLGRGVPEAPDVRRIASIAACLLAAGLLFHSVRRAPAEPPVIPHGPSAASARPAVSPALRGEHGAIAAGSLLTGSPGAPVTVSTRLPENGLSIDGSVKVLSIEEIADNPRNARLKFELQAGGMFVEFPRGRTTVSVEAARTSVEIVNGRVSLALAGSDLVVTVYQGVARVHGPGDAVLEVRSGQRGHFRDGSPTQPIEAPEGLRRPESVSHSHK